MTKGERSPNTGTPLHRNGWVDITQDHMDRLSDDSEADDTQCGAGYVMPNTEQYNEHSQHNGPANRIYAATCV